MAIPMKLIFGIRTSQVTKLVVNGGPTSTILPLLITTRDKPTETSVPCEQGVWTADLMQGDHMVRIEVPNENDWFDGLLTFTVSPDAKIVFFGPKNATSEPELNSWSAMGGTTGGQGGSDPKDPWPPPLAATRLTIDDAQWFTDMLHDTRMNIAIMRSGPPGE